MARGFQKPQHDATETDLIAFTDADVRERSFRERTQVNLRAGSIRQLAMTADEVRMQMRLNDVPDREPLPVSFFDVQGDIALRVDDASESFRPEHIRRVRKARQVELLKVHLS
jgi:hypothetical protein